MTTAADGMPAPGTRFLIGAATLAGTVAFFQLQNLITWTHEAQGPPATAVVLACALATSLIFFRVRHDPSLAFLGSLTRTLAVGLAVYLTIEPPVFTLARPAGADAFRMVQIGYWPALIAAILAWWRPSMLIFPAFYVPATRLLADDVSGLPISSLDMRTLCEMAALLALGRCVLWLIARTGRDVPPVAGQCLGYAAIALHLGNYFWSAVAKLRLGPSPWTWALENPTDNMMLVGLHKGVLPSGAWPELTERLYDAFGAAAPATNTAVLVLQLAALAAAASPLILRLACWGYEALHTAIYLLGGLFFWPWMWINMAALLAVRRLPDQRLALAPRLTCVAVLLSGALPHMAAPARLAWFDLSDIRSPIIELREADGPWVRVPGSFFLSHSYSISHGYHGLAPLDGHYRATIWGVSGDYDRMLTSGTCPEPGPVDYPETPEEKSRRMAVLGALLSAHHAAMLERTADPWRAGFYVRSHHHPSNPLLHRAFAGVDLSRVTAYRLREVSVCLALDRGRLVERIRREDITEFPLDADR